ncbi:MAG TPA: histidinol-phosphatase HisJ family protein, partial [Chloroflexota bacterium]
ALLVDYHSHTTRCGHATGTMEQFVERAIQGGLAEFGFSDHVPLYFLPVDRRDPSLAMREEELPEYVESVLRLRDRYSGQIAVRLGLEADYFPGREEELRRLLEPYPWDYVYGSVHFLGDWGFDDPRHLDRYGDWDIDELYRFYFDHVISAARTGLFDVMGHLDLVKKFGHRAKGNVGPLYAGVAEVLKQSGVAVEVSTAGLRKPVHEIYPGPDLLAECARQGVPATMSSDAHSPSEVGYELGKAVDALRAAGYSSFVRFERRHKIPTDL